jgi:hypothetical protein
MRDGSGLRRLWVVSAIAMAIPFLGCGGDAGLTITKPTGQCTGGTGPRIEGVVRMPHGEVAQRAGALQRLAAAVWAQAAAITGAVSPVGPNVEVALVELRQEDLDDGSEPGAVDIATTGDDGEYCIRLPDSTDHNVCRYVVQVGNGDDGTLTRAFVFSSPAQIDIDYQSEATVRVILAQIPPATLCDFSPAEINNIYNAVRIAPGEAIGENADEINAVAASIAAADPVVDDAISVAYNRPRTPSRTPTQRPPTVTPTGPTPTRTEIVRRTDTPTPRVTRTGAPATRTATSPVNTLTPTRPPTRTSTPG